jgi:hypothetical protein
VQGCKCRQLFAQELSCSISIVCILHSTTKSGMAYLPAAILDTAALLSVALPPCRCCCCSR